MATVTFSDISQSGVNSGNSGNYATVHAGNNLGLDGSPTGGVFHSFDNVNYSINRWYLTFDTSSLPDDAIIQSAFIRFPGAGTKVDTNAESITLVSTTMPADSPVTGDFGNVGSTSFGALAISGWSNSSNNDITLNATGMATISLSAKSKFGVRTSGDISSTPPTNPGNKAQFTTNGVILSVTYASGGMTPNSRYW